MFTPIETGDGSSTFYSETFGEWFHSREGACNEAQQTYVETSRLAQRVQQIKKQVGQSSKEGSPLKILDICYGLGYNTAAALETIWAVDRDCPVEIKALEIDIEVSRSAIAQGLTQRYSPALQDILQAMATAGEVKENTLLAQLLLGDARQTLQVLVAQGWQADVIFLDPFSPPHCPQLWTVDFLQLVAQCLQPQGGALVTYSCAAAVRSALKIAGLSIGSTQTTGRKWPGTIARYDSLETAKETKEQVVKLPPLSQQEMEHLQTRAAVPYRDSTLRSTAEEILARRLEEQTNSELMPTKPWRQRWRVDRGASDNKTLLFSDPTMKKSSYLVDVQWLSQHLHDADVVVIDTRFSLADPELGRHQYQAGHIPGAYYFDLNQDLSSSVQAHGGRHPLPDWEKFTAKLNQIGIQSKPATQVVIYDDSRFAFAARLWWMLRYLGHESVAILDGGIQAWEAAGLPLETGKPDKKQGNFVPHFQMDWVVDIEAVRQRKDLPGVVVIDSRSPERFRGEVEPIDPIAGSIPGAVNSFWKQITTEAGQLKSTNVLCDQWADINSNDEVMVYCGSGVTACVNLFSLVMAGHPMHKLYPGGWSDWCSYEK